MVKSRSSLVLIAALSLVILFQAAPAVCVEKDAGKSAAFRADGTLPSQEVRYEKGRISADFKNRSVSEILTEIADQSNVMILGIEGVSDETISVRIRNQSVEDGLRRVLRAAGLNNFAMFYRTNPEQDGFEVKKIVFLTDDVNLSGSSRAVKTRPTSLPDNDYKRTQPKDLNPSKRRSREAAKRARRQREARRATRPGIGDDLPSEENPIPFPPEDLLRGHPLMDMLNEGDFKGSQDIMNKLTETLDAADPNELQKLFEPLMEGAMPGGAISNPAELEAIAEEMLSEFMQGQ